MMHRRLFWLLIPGVLAAQSPFSSEVDSLIHWGLARTFVSDYDSAMTCFARVVERVPEHPVGYFYRAAALQSKMMDFETSAWETEFFIELDSALALGHRLLDSGDEDPWTTFYLGTSYSYKGLYDAKSGRLLAGLLNARRGMHFLRETVERHPWLYDAYIGVGSYFYWSGRFYRFFSWLPWIRDDRENGIRILKEGVSRATFSRWPGVNSLAWIQYDRKNYKGALTLFRQGLKRYPGSRFFHWGEADCLFQMGNFPAAIESYNALLLSVKNVEMDNDYNTAVCLWRLIQSHEALKHDAAALQLCEELLLLKGTEESRGRLVKIQKQAARVRKELRSINRLE